MENHMFYGHFCGKPFHSKHEAFFITNVKMGKVTISDADKAHSNQSKKRSVRRDEWKSNVAQSSRNSGQAYRSKRGNGAMVAAKQCRPAGKRCAARCHNNGCDLTLEQKQHIFDSYWGSADYEKQRTYLGGLLQSRQAGIRVTHKYYLNVEGERREVCKFTFMDIHQVSKDILKTVQQKKMNGDIFVQDRRGKHENQRRIDDEEVDFIRSHILGYDFRPVHYSRKDGHDQYLPSHLNVDFMFREFKAANPDRPNVEKKLWLYRQVFKDTGILPYEPKSDTCRTCDRLHIKALGADDNERDLIQSQISEHLIKGDLGYRSLYDDIALSRNTDDVVVLCVDIQKVLFTPTLTHSDMFYSRQLSTYNLCIYDGRNDIGNMVLWTETEGKRGVNEMASAILHYIRRTFPVLNAGQTRRLILWSDRCRGQFNNFHIICFLLALVKDAYFTEVEQKFLLSWHSFMPCDRLFALIEKRKHSCQALIPRHWERIIREAQPNKPFQINRLATGEIFDIKSFEAIVPRPVSLKVTEVARVLISRDSPTHILTRNSHCNVVTYYRLV